MNLFDELLKHYCTKWAVKDERPFTEEEINCVDHNIIEKSQYGNSVCFFMKDGSKCYIPCDINMTLGVGESIDMTIAKVITLQKDDEDDILRVMQ